MWFALQRRLRRSWITAVLVVTPWLPGALAVPLMGQGMAMPAAGTMLDSALSAAPAATPSGAAPDSATADAGAPPDAGGEQDGATLPDPALPDPKPGEVWVEVALAEQKVRVYRERRVIREMTASTGTADEPTPVGSFRLQNRGPWFFSKRYGQGGFYWVSFLNWGEYLFHSVPTDEHRRIIPEEAAKLGTPASHGCVRLSLEDARWFYENMPSGTRVEIHL